MSGSLSGSASSISRLPCWVRWRDQVLAQGAEVTDRDAGGDPIVARPARHPGMGAISSTSTANKKSLVLD